MAFRPVIQHSLLGSLLLCAATLPVTAQVFVVGEKTATDDISTDFHPTRIELPATPMSGRGRMDLVRNLEAEQGFAHRPLPLGTEFTLIANGNMTPNGDAYKQLLYKKGESARIGDRIAITAITIKPDRIVLDLNGGPYLNHRFLRHFQVNGMDLAPNDGAQVTGCRVTLLFEGPVPEVTAPEVKALLDPIIDFSVKSSAEAYADSLPQFLRAAIAQHDVLVGMDRRMVLAAMGQPESKERELVPGSDTRHYEEWIYGHAPQTVRFVRFQGDLVTQVRVAALGQPIAVHTQNEMQGWQDPENIREVAEGDAPPAGGDDTSGPHSPPTILKAGEAAPGSMRRVLLPTSPVSDGKEPAPDSKSNGGDAAPASTPAEPPPPVPPAQFQSAELL